MNIAIHFGDHPMFLNQFHIVASVKKTESPRINHRHIMVTWLHGYMVIIYHIMDHIMVVVAPLLLIFQHFF
jgi:hypothetical protein